MIEGRKVLAVIPARSGSRGLPGKNIRMLHGRPLLVWPIVAALNSRYVDRVVVSTDSERYAEIGRAAGADVPFLRPVELATDSAPSIGFVFHAIDTLEAAGDAFDYFVLLEPTSPLTESADVDIALDRLIANRVTADSIVGVSQVGAAHPAFAVRMLPDGSLRPQSGRSFSEMPRRQDTEPLHMLDGSLYISSIDALRRERSFYHARTIGYSTPRWKAFEVDDLLDFVCVEAIIANLDALRSSFSS